MSRVAWVGLWVQRQLLNKIQWAKYEQPECPTTARQQTQTDFQVDPERLAGSALLTWTTCCDWSHTDRDASPSSVRIITSDSKQFF